MNYSKVLDFPKELDKREAVKQIVAETYFYFSFNLNIRHLNNYFHLKRFLFQTDLIQLDK